MSNETQTLADALEPFPSDRAAAEYWWREALKARTRLAKSTGQADGAGELGRLIADARREVVTAIAFCGRGPGPKEGLRTPGAEEWAAMCAQLTTDLARADKRLRDALTATETIRADDGWQSIETAPRDGSHVLLADAVEQYVAQGYWETSEGHECWTRANEHWADAHDTELIGITHWRQLPEPPAKGDEQ